jgi:hypothetical protein
VIGYLCSFAFYERADLQRLKERVHPAPLFADSGAFTAHTIGQEVQLPEYARWLYRWHRQLHVYANLDAIGDPAATWANQLQLQERGLRPMPVVHLGAPMDDLRRALDDGHGYIALGGLVTGARNRSVAFPWIDECFRTAEAHGSGAVFHGFGFLRQDGISRWPWYSVDASSFGAGHRYAQMKLFDHDKLRSIAIRDRAAMGRNADSIRRHRGNLARFLDGTWHWKDALDVNAVAYARLARWWSDRVPAVHRPDTDDAPAGPIVYLADVNPVTLARAAHAIRLYEQEAAA